MNDIWDIDDFLLKSKLTENEEIQLLKRIADEYSGTDLSYYRPHLDKIIIKYKENIDKIKELESRINELQIEKTITKEKQSKIDDIEDMKNIMENFGVYSFEYRRLENVHKFLILNKEKTFQRKNFTTQCKISTRTASKYLPMLEKCNFIVKFHGKGKYRVSVK